MKKKNILITGGAGFIGVNLTHYLLSDPNNNVIVYDNLSRKGVEHNLAWIQSLKCKNLAFIKGDVRDYIKLKEVVEGIDEIYHLAAQVAVTSSVENPVDDFEINAFGTLCLLEAVRRKCLNAILVFSSTNKVYGELLHLELQESNTRYAFTGDKKGISEQENLDFHSPYGVSKGTADQYIRDYHRIYGTRSIVFRQSCIYGQHQYGNEDQGWVAHFIIKSLLGKKINIYGDGKQVRDLLEVRDLINAYMLAVKNIEKTQGEIYNAGGGIKNTLSLLELIFFLAETLKKEIEYELFPWRPGDQKIFVSDNTKLEKDLSWKPNRSAKDGIRNLIVWIKDNIELIKNVST